MLQIYTHLLIPYTLRAIIQESVIIQSSPDESKAKQVWPYQRKKYFPESAKKAFSEKAKMGQLFLLIAITNHL